MKKNLFQLCVGVLLLSAQINAQVSFNASTQNGCAPLAITFTNTSATGNYYQWSYGDGSPMTYSVNASHTYNNAGNYMVMLTAYDTTGHGMLMKGQYMIGINVNGLNMNLTTDTACPNQSIGFNIYMNVGNISWSFGDGSPIVTNQQNTQHAYSAQGNYTVTLSADYPGCGNQSVSQVIIIKNGATPNAQFYYSNVDCPHDIINFNPQDYMENSYFWDFGDGSPIINTTNNNSGSSHSYSVTGNYVVTLTVTSSCGTSSVQKDTVHIQNNIRFPNWTQVYTSSMNVCPNDMVNFNTNTNALSYLWTFQPGDTSNQSNPSFAFTTVGNHTVTAKLTNGCGIDTVVSTVVNVGTNIPFNGYAQMQFGPNPACPIDPINFQSSSAAAYKWYFGDGDSSTLSQTMHSYAGIGTYTVTLKLYNNCGRDTVLKNNLVITNTVVPILSHDNGNGNNNWGAGTITGCPGDSMLFYAYGADSYNFDFGDGHSSSNTHPLIIQTGGGGTMVVQTISHAYSALGNYVVKLTITNGCGKSASDTINVHIGGSSPVNGGIANVNNGPVNTCQPVSMIGIGGVSYIWHFGDGDSLHTTTATISHSYTNAGTYTVSLNVKNGCGNSAVYTQTLMVMGMTTSVNSTPPSCFGQNNGSAQVMVTSGGNNPFTYSIDGGAYSPTNTFGSLSAGIYTIMVRDTFGCKVANTFTLTGPTQLALTVSSSNSAGCGGATGSATVVVTGGTTPYTYNWQGGSTAITASNLHAGSYSVTITDANNCTAITTAAINDAGGPTVTYTTPYSAVCANASPIALNGGSPAGGTYSGGGVSAGSFVPNSSNVGSNVIVYTYSNAGCIGTASNTIIVNALPNMNVTSNTSGNQICDGSNVTLIATGATSYTWSVGSVTTNTVSVSPTTNSTYTVTGSNGSCSDKQTISISVNAVPATPTITPNGNVLTSSAANTYQWFMNNNPIVGATSQSYTATQAGSYQVQVTNISNCTSISTSYTVNSIGIATQTGNVVQTLVRPNPFSNSFELDLTTDDGNASIELYNAIGQRVAVIYSGTISSGNNHFTFNTLPDMQNGMYFVKIQTESFAKIIKVSLVK